MCIWGVCVRGSYGNPESHGGCCRPPHAFLVRWRGTPGVSRGVCDGRGWGEPRGAQWGWGVRSCEQKCLLRSEDHKYEHFERAWLCGIPLEATPGLGRAVWRWDAGLLFPWGKVRSGRGLPVSGADRESRKGLRLISEAGSRLKESGKMVRVIEEARTDVEQEGRRVGWLTSASSVGRWGS